MKRTNQMEWFRRMMKKTIRSRLISAAVLAVISIAAAHVAAGRPSSPAQETQVPAAQAETAQTEEPPGIKTPAVPAEDEGYLVHVVADGVSVMVRLSGGTVADAIEQAGVDVDEIDRMSIDDTEQEEKPAEPDTVIESDARINIQRVEIREYQTVETLDFNTVTKFTGDLPNGKVKIAQEGKKGSVTRVYRDEYVDGVKTGTVLVSEVKVEPVHRIRMVGTVANGVPKSPAPFDIPLDSAGQPLQYSRMYTGKASAYTNDRGICGDTTASGRPAQVGVVAVDPKKIPYGTKLYIVSPDGKIVYGYAIAGDVGGGTKSGRLVTDLFMNTYEECIQFGVRTMNVYVLE